MTTPRYEVIAAHYRGRIIRGELAPGDQLPAEREIAETWQVARGTVVRALGVLRAEELIESRQGTGTIVRAHLPVHRSARERYDTARVTGYVYPSGEHATITGAAVVPAPDHVAAVLGIDEGADALRRDRVTYEGERVTSVSSSWFPAAFAERAPRLLTLDRVREGTTRYVEMTLGLRPDRGRSWWSARIATDAEAAALGLDAPAAVAEVRSADYAEDGTVIEYGVSVAGAGRWSRSEEYSLRD